MNEPGPLDSLANLLNDIAESPYDFSLHVQHIRLVKSDPSLESQIIPACEMFTSCFAAGDEIWMPIIDAKQAEINFDSSSKEQFEDLLRTYDSAERDYLCAPQNVHLKSNLDPVWILRSHSNSAEASTFSH
jgi:hypothetical protein